MFNAIKAKSRWLILTAAVALHPSITKAQQTTGATNQWEVLENCRLAPDEFADGDSFHVLHESRQYIFRLYFVDAPESDPTLRDRIEDQAAYFGIAQSDVARAGALASKFVQSKLTGTNFTVTTRWQNAMGRSSLARFYCGITVGNENLAEQLVANGLARIYGIRANFPNQRSTTFINKLKNLELSAREKKLGVWNETQFPRAEAVAKTTSTNDTPSAVIERAPTTTATVDLNTATRTELMSLPGIGKVLAERIVTNRPYATVDDLKKVPGIGEKTLEKLRPLIEVTRVESSTPKSE